MSPTAEAVVRAALRHAAGRVGLLNSGQTLAVAYSGGQDSTCLLHAVLAATSRRRVVRIVAAHVDHALRRESGEDAERLVAIAERLGVELVVRRVDVSAYKEEAGRRWSVQHAARAARYHALASICAEVGADRLLLAHTADDQAETLLLNLMRGTGLSGLSGMRLEAALDPSELGPALPGLRSSQIKLVRPLLSLTRAQTLAYCEVKGLPLVLDPTNQKDAYTRNRVRHDLLPVLERFNPSIREALARTADLLSEEEAALEQATVAVRSVVVLAANEDQVTLDCAGLRALPRALQRRLVRWGIEQLAGTLVDVASGPVDDALDFLLTTEVPEAEYHLPRGVRAVRTGPALALKRYQPGISPSRSEPSV